MQFVGKGCGTGANDTSHEGSRIVESLLASAFIDRSEPVYNGRETYFLEPKANRY